MKMAKRYALFAGDCFYPKGGWADFVGFYDTLEAADTAAVEPDQDAVSGWFYNISDLETGEIVASEWGLESRWAEKSRAQGPVEGALTGDEESLEVALDEAGRPVRQSLKGRGI
jgi:hypothetical protein